MNRRIQFKIVKVDKLTPNPYQPRIGFAEESLRELAESLKSRGEIQPIIAREHKEGYQIIAGERRWRAARLAGLKEIPVLVRDTSDDDVLLESLIENLHREDLSSIERENAVYELWKSGRWKSYAELAKSLGKSGDWVGQQVRAAEIRRKEKYGPTVSTGTIIITSRLKEKERKRVIEKVEKGELPITEVPDVVRVLKKAPEPVKKAVLKPKSRITPRVAEKISELPESEQTEIIKQVEALRLDEDEALFRIEALKRQIEPPPPQEIEKVREGLKATQERIRSILETEDVKERGELFRNWLAHQALLEVVGSASCPICGADGRKLVWKCHGLNVEEALDLVHKKYQESLGGEKKR